jgi:hypothetical protein
VTSAAARRWHLLTAAVAIGALTLQLLLVVFGEPLLVEEHGAGPVVRLARFASYFTIQSNTLVAITALQLAVPALAVIGWASFGPRPRITLRVIGWALVWPIAWLVWTLGVGAITGWYPYPFLDVDAEGAGSVTVSALGVTALFVIVFAALRTVDRRAAPAPRPG